MELLQITEGMNWVVLCCTVIDLQQFQTSGDYAPMAGYNPSREYKYNHSRGNGDYTGWAPWYQHISIFSTHQTGKHSHRSHQVSLVCLFLCMICLQPIQTENNTALAQGEGGCQV